MYQRHQLTDSGSDQFHGIERNRRVPVSNGQSRHQPSPYPAGDRCRAGHPNGDCCSLWHRSSKPARKRSNTQCRHANKACRSVPKPETITTDCQKYIGACPTVRDPGRHDALPGASSNVRQAKQAKGKSEDPKSRRGSRNRIWQQPILPA
jgi:hypothetical protein